MSGGDPGVFPEGELYALTYEIPHTFGGLTKAMLQRSGQFAALTGRDVVVLTLEHEPELDDIRVSLRERGLLADGVTILNLWEQLEAAGDEVWAGAPFDPTVGEPELEDADACVRIVRRTDGSVLARQRWRLPERPVEVLRTEIFDRDGAFLGGWHGSWPLWRWWLASVVPPTAHLVVDDAYTACCLAAAPLAGIPTTYVMHNNHIAQNRQIPYGRIERWRSYTVPRSDGFDAIVYLTHAQRRDVAMLHGPEPHAHVVPNAYDPPGTPPHRRRPAGRGVVMSLLVKRKRIPHAVRAVAEAAKTAPHVSLTIYGSGTDRDAIVATIEEHAAPVHLEGFTHDPAAVFAGSSYLLLTSHREGLPLVLAESMTAGCLPVAYDLGYGPSDIVRDGVDGYVVTSGDVHALADRIVEIATMPRRRLRRMRRRARRRAKDFTPAAVVPRWGPVLHAAAERAATRPTTAEPTLSELTELERVAGLHRLDDCRVEATLVDLTWDRAGVADLLVSCAVVGAGERTGSPEVDVALVHRPSGSRVEGLPVEIVPAPSSEPPGVPTTTVRITIDPAAVGDPADHVLLVRARLGEIRVLDTIVLPEGARGWLPMPPATSRRPVLVPHPRDGLQLVTATPHVAGDAMVGRQGVQLSVDSLDGGAIESVQAKSLDSGGVNLDAERHEDGTFVVNPSEDGRWKLRARVDGRWRDVAWRGPEPVPPSTGEVRLELTPRGYLRFRREAVQD